MLGTVLEMAKGMVPASGAKHSKKIMPTVWEKNQRDPRSRQEPDLFGNGPTHRHGRFKKQGSKVGVNQLRNRSADCVRRRKRPLNYCSIALQSLMRYEIFGNETKGALVGKAFELMKRGGTISLDNDCGDWVTENIP